MTTRGKKTASAKNTSRSSEALSSLTLQDRSDYAHAIANSLAGMPIVDALLILNMASNEILPLLLMGHTTVIQTVRLSTVVEEDGIHITDEDIAAAEMAEEVWRRRNGF